MKTTNQETKADHHSDSRSLAEKSQETSLESFNYEKILSATKATLMKNIQRYYPQLNTLSESDPLIKTIQIASYRELYVRQKIKEVIDSSLLNRSRGEALVQLANLILERKNQADSNGNDSQTDREIKNNIFNFWNNTPYYTTGTEPAYIYFTKQVASDCIRDVSVIKENPAEISIYILLESESETSLNTDQKEELLKKVKKQLENNEIRRITDKIQVAFAETIPFNITATIDIASNYCEETIRSTINAALMQFNQERFCLGNTLSDKHLFKVFHQQGVKNVGLILNKVDNTKTHGEDTGKLLHATSKQALFWNGECRYTFQNKDR